MWARLYWGETPQTPLSVFDVGFAHVRGRPPKTPQILFAFSLKIYYLQIYCKLRKYFHFLHGCLGCIICWHVYIGGGKPPKPP